MANEEKTQAGAVETAAAEEAEAQPVAAEEQAAESEAVAGAETAAADLPDAAALQRQLAVAQEEIAALKDQQLRLQAEMQNIRRRAEQDVEKAHKFGLERFANEMLPIVDSLERAVESCGDDEAHKAVREGVEITLNMFISGLAKFNIEQVNPQGETFDPVLHQAMSLVDAGEAAPNSVVAVMQKGYTLNGRLVRPAMVMVAKS